MCFCRVFPPLPPTDSVLFLGSDLETSRHLLAIQWPPVSAGTLLTDSPAQGWARERAGLPTSQSNPVSLPLSPNPCCPPPLQHGRPSLWPPRSCHLGYAIPTEVGDRGPHLQGLTPPPTAPFFLLKGTDCNLGAGTCLPPASGSPKARRRPSHRPRTGARAGEAVSPEAGAPSSPPTHPLSHMQP